MFTWYNVYIITSATSAKDYKCVYTYSIFIVTRAVFTLLQMSVTYSALGEECFFYSMIKRDVLFCIWITLYQRK